MNDDFLSVLASCTEAAEGMDLGDNKWKPPSGPYTVSITKIDTGTYVDKKSQENRIRICPTFRIVDGEFEGKTFGDFYGIAPGAPDIPSQINLKSVLQFATCMAGRDIRDPVEAIGVLEGSIGDFIALEVWRGKPNSKGIVFANLRFLNRLDAVAEEAEVAEDVTT